MNVGPAHIISFSTEFYYFLEFGWKQLIQQYLWLVNDLHEANKPENRALRPWIITMGHRPMYCSTDDKDDCTHKNSIVRLFSFQNHFTKLLMLFNFTTLCNFHYFFSHKFYCYSFTFIFRKQLSDPFLTRNNNNILYMRKRIEERIH